MNDNDAFEPKGNQDAVINAPRGTYKVEAVAGSGKTTTMVERIRADIRDREIAPNRILVLTFATEAAHTIQEKLRERLSPHDAFEVDVYNYHSFCYHLLKDHAYYLGLSPDFELVTEEKRPQLIESVYDEIDASFVDFGDPSQSDDEGTLSDLTDFIDKMRREGVRPEDVREFLPSDEAIREILSLESALQDMAGNLVDVNENDIMWEEDEIAERCKQAARVYQAKSNEFDAKAGVGPEIPALLRSMKDIAESLAEYLQTSDDPDWWEYCLPEVLLGDGEFRRGNPTQTPMGRLSEYAHMLRRARAFVDAYEAYLSILDARGALDYDELIHRAVRLLRDDKARETILSRWDAVYCDEFQDTDTSQFELVEEFRDELDVMLIGDSDQAIHEWRGQDPENMSNLPAEFEEKSIGLNFRSRQPILDLTNYIDRDTTRIEAQKEPNPPNVFKVNSEGEDTAAQVETTISNLLSGRFDDVDERDLADVAILVRQNYQARRIARHLEAEGIPCSLSKEAADELGQGLRTVLSYLRILVNPHDDVSWQRVLLHLYRVPESDIDTVLEAGPTIPEGFEVVSEAALSQVDRLDDALDDYRTLRDLAATHSISELYLHLKQETRIEWFLREHDRDAIQNVDHLISSFDDSPVQSRLTEEFVDYLERQAQVLVSADETATSQGTESTEAVDIMTVH
ncbi:ATP-dependent helicase [Halomicrobium salinisoli]|uniref:ATP-dependent helicase n=1 Tax=Halomicrobium salinisoli TaxID=2878391 RepID=UPI0030B80831